MNMRRTLLWFLYLFWVIVAQTPPYDFETDIESITRRQDEERVIVGRLPLAANGSVPHRREIRQMHGDQYQWDLFVLALSMFQSVSQSDPLSWYQVAGIHGVPFRTWNGVEPAFGANMSGYCTHSSVLFPMWHRPYLALVEQEIFRIATTIAGMFPNSTERRLYQQAASTLRLPYWDWAVSAPPDATHFPEVFWHPTIQQYGPRGVQTIRNPLYSYVFNPVEEDAMIWSPLRSWRETKRAPATNISLDSPPSMNEQVNEALLAKLPEIQQRLFVLFSGYKDFNSFGNKAWAVSQNLSSLDSIESIHDIIHIFGGLRGHLTYVPLSSFDPLFFIHHVSTDRLIALWQILNPDAWMSPMAAGETSYNTLRGEVQSSGTPLTPFYISADGIFWTSDMARDLEIFGYNYADTDPSLHPGQDLREIVNRKIREWYGGSSAVSLKHRAGQLTVKPQQGRGAVGGPFTLKDMRPNVKNNAEDPPAQHIIRNGQYTEWVVNLRTDSGALDGSFSVHFFFGRPSGNCHLWNTAPNEVGSIDIFAMKHHHSTGSQSKISGSLPLTSALMKMVATGTLADLQPDSALPFLQEALQFRVCRRDGMGADPRSVKDLHIGVTATQVEIPDEETELPIWGRPIRLLELWS